MNTVSTGLDAISSGLFPISFNAHIIFTIISVLFFLMQFARQKQKYQLLSAIAIPIPLILYINSSSIVFNIIGIVELVLVLIIGSMLFVNKKEDDTSANAKKGKD